jgi:YD repeat-containing protein
MTDPLNNVTKYAYDLDHQQISATDPANYSSSKAYDLDGLVISTTDQNNNTTLLTLDPRGDVVQKQVPHDTSGTTTYDTTQYAYDQAGNRTKMITPRGSRPG